MGRGLIWDGDFVNFVWKVRKCRIIGGFYRIRSNGAVSSFFKENKWTYAIIVVWSSLQFVHLGVRSQGLEQFLVR